MWFWSSFCCFTQIPSESEKPESINKNKTGTPDSESESLETSLQELSSQKPSIVNNTSPSLPKNETLVLVPDLQPEANRQSLWGNWKLDTEFLRQIREWNLNHPQKKLIHIFKVICDEIDEESPFLELIPDTLNVIPIRGFIKSIIHFCKLAAAVASAKEIVFTFMLEIVTWLDGLACTFDSGDEGKLQSEAWKSLDDMGQLINDACHWANDLLLGPGTAISRQLSAERQIQYYRNKFTRITERFSIISGIRLAQGLDSVAQGMDDVAQGVHSVAQNIRMIVENENSTERLQFLKEKLLLRIIENSSYNHQEKRPCEPGTRIKILDEIRSWIHDVSEDSQRFYWLSGGPGVGKSTITASIVRDCVDRDILGAQFFINRNDATTTDPRAIFPTICWQLCQRFPRVAMNMEKTLRVQPSVVDDISDDQATKLFVDAIHAAKLSDLRPVVVVIDGLDETDTKCLRHLAQILSRVVVNLPINAKMFISSRTEEAITNSFNPLDDRKQVKSRYLTAKESIEEVSQFMEKKVKGILEDYNMDWANWGDDRMRKLSSQASGLYIWAETALKYLRAEIENSGDACFGGLLDILTDNGMGDINTLYLNILRRTCKPGDWEHQRFRRVIGAILVCQTPLSIADLGQLLKLREHLYSNPVDLVHFVRQYRTVLVNNTKEINRFVVPRLHKSFADFITSKWAQEFCIDETLSHGEIALRCIRQLDDLIPYLKREKLSFPTHLVYVSQHWQLHLTRMVEPDTIYNHADEMNERITRSILEENDTKGSPGISTLGPTPKSKLGDVLSFAFSPDGTQIASSHIKGTIRIWDARTGSRTISLIGHEKIVTSVGFSPDSTQLISSSEDRTARIWDARSGRELHVLRGHTDVVGYAGFSHDGRIVVTCSLDWTFRTWDTRTSQQLNVFQGHKSPVRYCSFSPSDQRIASFTYYGDIIVWDVNSGNLVSEIYYDECDMIAFCPCGNHIMSCDRDGTTMLWDAESGNPLDHVKSTIAQLAFVKELEKKQESANNYIHIPPAVSDHKIPHIYTLKTEYGDVWAIVEQGQGIWGLLIPLKEGGVQRLYFDMGSTRMY